MKRRGSKKASAKRSVRVRSYARRQAKVRASRARRSSGA